MDISQLTAYQLADKIRSKELSAGQAATAALDATERLNGTIRAFLSIYRQEALQRAEMIDAAVAAGQSLGPLAGVPVAIKDNMTTSYGTTTCASKILEHFEAPYDAHVVQLLNDAGAIIVGKTNLDEFAMGSSTESSALGITRNPWNTECVPGGSSGGSAAAIAGGMVPVALGSDTGGSIRQPAALCGVCGMKPTYGRVSRYGLVAYGSSLDQIGPLGTDARDLALMLNVIAGYDKRDSTSVPQQDAPTPDYLAQLARPPKSLKIAIVKEYMLADGLDGQVSDAVNAALKTYQDLGAKIIEVSMPHTDYAIGCYYLIATAEASSNLARYDGVHYGHRTADPEDYIDMYSSSRAEGFGSEVKRRIMLGTYVLSAGYYDAYYLKALKVRTLIGRDFRAAFKQADVVICPTSPTAAFKIGEKVSDPLTMYLSDIYTISVNLAGIPAVSIPCGLTEQGLPIGLQLMANHFDEAKLLQAAWMFQQATEHHKRRPAANGN